MTDLTKTEQRLLRRLQSDLARGRIGVEWAVGRGPKGGSVNSGAQEYRAARSLVRKGLATVHSEWRTPLTRGGYTVHVAGLRIELKENK